ncbi:hypothetical protein B0H14DRAFT_2581198 [Mycena olivaceomarginata]|nr:hypothetical protein B0H14DRAFT_2581198 [Mycena olivaceomarginata]
MKGLSQSLLEHDADVNAQGRQYGSALQLASEHGHEGIVRLLLEHGTDIYAGVGVHDSAWCTAWREGHWAIFQLLFQHSAKDNAHIIKLLLEDSTDDPAHDDIDEEEAVNSSTATLFPIAHINKRCHLSVSDSDWDSDGVPPNRKCCQHSPEL